MRIGLLSDAHGNSSGLAACLDQLLELKIERIYFLGDAVGYLPGEREVLRLLRANNVFCQKGNHEAMLLGELSLDPIKDRIYGMRNARARLSESDRADVYRWPDHRLLEISGKTILLVHGSPANYLQGHVEGGSDMNLFDESCYDAVFMGHTHRPFIAREPGGTLVVNVGSCGIPRDQGNLLAFAVYDSERDDCEILRLPFDTDKVRELFHGEEIAEEVYSVFARRAQGSPVGRVIGGGSYS